MLNPGKRLERGEWIGAVEPQIAGEMVPRPVRNADEREVAFECNFGNGSKGAVAACDADAVRPRRPGQLRSIFPTAKDVCLDAARGGLLTEIVDARTRAARARIDEEVARQAKAPLAVPTSGRGGFARASV